MVAGEICGQIIGGRHGEILIRQKKDRPIEIGELLCIGDNPYIILMAYDLEYGSQVDKSNLELISGLYLEGNENLNFIEEELQNYIIAKAKAIAEVRGEDGRYHISIPKKLPIFFSEVRRISSRDLGFMKIEGGNIKNPLYLGCVRSGSRRLEDIAVVIDGEEALNHHILIPATTGRGKSNLVKVMLWHLIDKSYCGILVLDPHDEYYGRTSLGLKDHPEAKEYIKYYTPDTSVRGAINIGINLRTLRPWHFNGVISLSDAQVQAMHIIYRNYHEDWLVMIFENPDEVEDLLKLRGGRSETFSALKRKLTVVLDIYDINGKISENGIFHIGPGAGTSTVGDIVKALETGKKVIVDTSRLSSYSELLVGSTIAYEIMERYRIYKGRGQLEGRPSISIVLEEAVRVLGQRDSGEMNVFGMIAREGRKFKIGLIAITQLVSMIPREVLANMNTKIILGNEMSAERRAIIESASQDLSTEGKMISSLDKGEAICSSIFTKFAIPIYTPLFDELVQRAKTTGVNDKKQTRITYFP